MSGKNTRQKGLNRTEIEQVDIVLIDFSYSDLKRSKLRPALVMSNSAYNSTSLDIVALRITSQPKRRWAVKITNKDVGRGFLEVESYVKVDSIFTVENNMIAKFVGKLNEMKINEVKLKLDELFDVGCRGCLEMIG